MKFLSILFLSVATALGGSLPVQKIAPFFLAQNTGTPASCGDFSLVNSAGNFIVGNGTCEISGLDTTGAKLYVVIAQNQQTGAGTFSDGMNTYVALPPTSFQRTDGTGAWQTNQVLYCINPVTTNALKLDLVGTNAAFYFFAFSCSGTVTFDQQTKSTTTTGHTIQAGPQTPNGSELFFAGLGWFLDSSVSIDSSFTFTSFSTSGGFVAGAYKVSSSAENPTWTVDGPDNPAGAALASFRSTGCSGGGGGGGAWTVVAHVGMSAISSGGTSSAINTTGAGAIFIGEGSFSGCPKPTDSKANSYFCVVSNVTANYYASIWACTNPVVGSGHTFTSSANYGNLNVIALSGGAGGVTDKTNSFGNSGIASVQPGSITPSVNNELIITVLNTSQNGDALSVNQSFTITDQLDSSAGAERTGVAYLMQTTAAAVNPTWSASLAADRVAAIASFK